MVRERFDRGPAGQEYLLALLEDVRISCLQDLATMCH